MTSFEEYVGIRRIVYVDYNNRDKARNISGAYNNVFRDVVAVNFFDKAGFLVLKQKVNDINVPSNECRTSYIPLDNIALIETFDSEEVFKAAYPQLPPLGDK